MYDRPSPKTNVENQVLKTRGLTTVSQLFNREEPRSLDRQVPLVLPRNLQIKIDNILANIKRKKNLEMLLYNKTNLINPS